MSQPSLDQDRAQGPFSSRQVFLGLFIIGQLLFLVSANLIDFCNDSRAQMGNDARELIEKVAPGWPQEKGHVWHLMDHLAKTDKMWAEATGQGQSWSLFAPAVSRECVFPAVLVRWDDDPQSAPALARPLALLAADRPLAGVALARLTQAPLETLPPELLLSPNEPADPEHYLRWGNYRLRRYEANFIITLAPFAGEKPAQTNERWSRRIREYIADYHKIILGYLRWRLDQTPGGGLGRAQPRQLILVFRRYHINDYADAPPYWEGPFPVQIARWQPAATWAAGYLPLEWYDPVTGRFKSLRP